MGNLNFRRIKPMRKRLTMQKRFRLATVVRSGSPYELVAASFGVGLPYVRRVAKDVVPFLELLDSERFHLNLSALGVSRNTLTRELYFEINSVAAAVCKKLMEEEVALSETKMKLLGLSIANRLGYHNFKASNGWLERFKKRNGIQSSSTKRTKNVSLERRRYQTLCGENFVIPVPKKGYNSWGNVGANDIVKREFDGNNWNDYVVVKTEKTNENVVGNDNVCISNNVRNGDNVCSGNNVVGNSNVAEIRKRKRLIKKSGNGIEVEGRNGGFVKRMRKGGGEFEGRRVKGGKSMECLLKLKMAVKEELPGFTWKVEKLEEEMKLF